MKELENILYEIKLHQNHLNTQRQVAMAEFNKEKEMLDKFEKWANSLKEELNKNQTVE